MGVLDRAPVVLDVADPGVQRPRDGLHPPADDEAPVVAPGDKGLDDDGAPARLRLGDVIGLLDLVVALKVEADPAPVVAVERLDNDREADPAKSRDTGLGVGVPGTVAGLSLALERFGYGKFTPAELVAPAVRLARDGIAIKDDLFDSLQRGQQRLARRPSAARIFLRPDGAAPALGDKLVQPELAQVLETIGREGQRAFYVGPVADKIVMSVRQAGGLMTRRDLEDYTPIIRDPVPPPACD